MLTVTNRWIYELIKRIKSGEDLYKKKRGRESSISENDRYYIRQVYEDLCYSEGKHYCTPSMTVLKNICEEGNLKLPTVCAETYRNAVKTIDCYPIKKKTGKIYRKRFEAPEVGMLVQGDVCTHPWIPMGLPFPLITFMDDHSRKVLYARFVDSDNNENHRIALKNMIHFFGKPFVIYYDNDPKYCPGSTLVKGLNDININVVNSKPYTPQGKGKVERKFGTFQKQLPFYMKLANPQNLEEANQVLDEYIKRHNNDINRTIKMTPNTRFLHAVNSFQPVTIEDAEMMEYVFLKREERKVDAANEISFNGCHYLVPKYGDIPLTRQIVEVREEPGQSIRIFYKGHFLIKYDFKEKNDVV